MVQTRAKKTLTERKRKPSRDMPQLVLWRVIECEFREYQPVWEREGIVEKRRFRGDIVLERPCILIEVDGWQYHAKYKSGFAASLSRQNEVVIAGWMVLRFRASEIYNQMDQVCLTIRRAIDSIESKQKFIKQESRA